MNAKLGLALVALVSVGVFALPSTVALFAGQHDFVNIDAQGNQISCVKCHADIQAEISAQGTDPATGTKSPHANFTCEACHRIEAGKASGDDVFSTITYKDAVSGATRKLIVLGGDMYARNVPAQILEGDTNAQIAAQATISGNKLSSSVNASPCYPSANCTDPSAILLAQAPRTMQASALYTQTGINKDARFDPSKVTWKETNIGLPNNSQTVNFTGVGSRTSNPGTAYHAASLVSCFECHGGEAPTSHHDADYTTGIGCAQCHYSSGSKSLTSQIVAGGFGLTNNAGDTGAIEAHKKFQTTADDNISRQTIVNGQTVSNGACVACHTHVAVDITYNNQRHTSSSLING